jgi:hypothetical protein
VRRLGWIGGLVGGIAAYRWVRRRPQVAAEPTPEPAPTENPAEELRAKLAESRTAETVVAEEAPSEPVAEEEEEAAVDPDSPDDRRRRVHEEGRAALDDMNSQGTDG